MKDRAHNGQKFEDTKRFNQKTQINEGQRTQWPKEKGHTKIFQTLHRKLKNEQCKPHQKPGVNSDVLKE